MNKKNITRLAVALIASSLFSLPASATTISLKYDVNSGFTGVSGQMALAGFEEAADFWESMFSDDVNIDLNIGFDALGAGILGSTGSTRVDMWYQNTAIALANDITSTVDQTAVNNLECTDLSLGICGITFLNTEIDSNGDEYTEYDIDGSASGLDDNHMIYMTQANAKALGLTTDVYGNALSGSDADITFSSDFAFDFDASNGIDVDKWDFVGVAIHEIGHALGFVSGVDIYDNNQGGQDLDNVGGIAATMDLFRYSSESFDLGVKDFRSGGDSYFSLDGGVTNIAPFSTGRTHGDGQQASHWKDNLNIGAMDPTAANGEFINVTGFDLLAFDAIGWDLRSVTSTVPEPTSLALFTLGALGLAGARRKKSSAKQA